MGYICTITQHFNDVGAQYDFVALDGLVVRVLIIVLKDRRFNPGQGRWIFNSNKNLRHDFFRRGSKAGSSLS
jgi:hypothetical protein